MINNFYHFNWLLNIWHLASPSKPVVFNASYILEKNSCYFEWDISFNGNSAITRLTIEYVSSDDKTKPQYEEIQLGQDNIRNLELKNCNFTNSIIRLKLGNIFSYSEFSDEIKINIIRPMPSIPGEVIAAVTVCFLLLTVLVVVFIRKCEVFGKKRKAKSNQNLEMNSIEENQYTPISFIRPRKNSSNNSIINKIEDNQSINSNTIHLEHQEAIARSQSLKELNDNWVEGIKNKDLDENLKQEFAVSN